MYRELYAASEPEMVRVAALTGLAATAGKESVTLLSQAIEGPEERIQAVAIRLLNQMPGPEITRMLIEQLPKLSATGQVRVLAALADRGDTSARPALLGAMKSGAPEVRIAGLEGLGRLGDASTVNLLAEAAARAEGAEQNAARESLARLRGAEVDRAIAAGIGAAGGNVRLELVRAAGERGPSAAAEVLLKTARDSDRELRRESLRALRDTASGQQAPALVDLLISAPSASDRREAERTLASVLRRSEGARINAVLSAYRSAQDLEARGSLLQVMGQTGNNEALPVLRDALRDGNPEIKRAAILALTEWPDPAPIEDLLEIARNDSSATHQVLALRGYIKLISIPAGRSATDMAKLLAEAMKAARQPDEKKAVLSLLPRYASKEALELAQAALSDEAVANEAKLAVERLKKSLGGR
jgi:HEAT repeat protein